MQESLCKSAVGCQSTSRHYIECGRHSSMSSMVLLYTIAQTNSDSECYHIIYYTLELLLSSVAINQKYSSNNMTHSNERGIFISYSLYYDPSGLIKPAIVNLVLLNFPATSLISMTHDMCDPANRKGILCSKCIDGYGPSVTSPNFKCRNCTNAFARYGIVIYWMLELIPVTVFYFAILIFQINLTSAPMVTIILYSQLVHNAIN